MEEIQGLFLWDLDTEDSFGDRKLRLTEHNINALYRKQLEVIERLNDLTHALRRPLIAEGQ